MKSSKKTAYALLRVTMGFNMMLHGIVRLPKIASFRMWVLETFEQGPIPKFVVYYWATVLPFIECTIGVLLIVGLFTRKIVLAGGVVITILIIGSCANERWEWAGIQMIYALFYYLLISRVEDNGYAVDKVFASYPTVRKSSS